MSLSRQIKDSKGVSTILVVGVLLFFLLVFFVVGIDFAYIYTVRGQMQNAADAAALAGAAKLNIDIYDTTQTEARDEAKKFSAENYAANEPVLLNDSDVSFGHWDGSSFQENATPVNAIQVITKRLQSRGNAVKLYFGRIVGLGEMDIEQIAVASNPARADVPVALCIDACEDLGGAGFIINTIDGTRFYWSPPEEPGTDPDIQQIAWTAFSDASAVNPPDVIPYFCGSVFDSCYVNIYTSEGYTASSALQFRCAFLNPLYDSASKTCEDTLGNPKPCTSITDKVTSWTALAPLTDRCPPSKQGVAEPYDIIGYAEIKIIDVFASGPATSAATATNCACRSLGPENFTAPEFTSKAVIINDISCVSCDDPAIEELLGKRAFLVK